MQQKRHGQKPAVDAVPPMVSRGSTVESVRGRARIRRDNDFARLLAKLVRQHPRLELITEPVLSTCCFRYIASGSTIRTPSTRPYFETRPGDGLRPKLHDRRRHPRDSSLLHQRSNAPGAH